MAAGDRALVPASGSLASFPRGRASMHRIGPGKAVKVLLGGRGEAALDAASVPRVVDAGQDERARRR
ncbi:hypothetical protein GQ53DRAFT_751148 [Thozetella sp. PMI_491]|nr:hypothetical protein GQ53DRAFT_751148 [Thozetella sp. PMI_491]